MLYYLGGLVGDFFPPSAMDLNNRSDKDSESPRTR